MAPIADDLLIRMLVRESLLRENVFDSVVQHLKQKFGNKYDAALNSQSLRQLIDPSKLASLRDEEIEYMLNPLSDSWFGRLGTTLGYDINFHKLLDGKNNYRAAISSEFVDLSVGFFKNLEKYYGIKRVVTLNSDGGGADIPAMVTAAGLESIYVPIEETSQPTRDQFEKIVNGLLSGNALIHCTNGADRTGAIVARYYIELLGWSVAQAMTDAKLYGFGESLSSLSGFLKGETDQKISASKIDAPPVQAAMATPHQGSSEKNRTKNPRDSVSPDSQKAPAIPMPPPPSGEILKYNSNGDELAPASSVINNFSRYGFQTPGPGGAFTRTPVKRPCHGDPKCKPNRAHFGIDYNRGSGNDDEGAVIVAPLDGVVTVNRRQGTRGFYLVLDHGDYGFSSYTHMKQLAFVSVGESVRAGQRVGLVGNTGRSGSSHLHFEVEKPAGNYIDPDPWLRSVAKYFPVAIKDGN